jgi:MSHA biogenesis protein MshL
VDANGSILLHVHPIISEIKLESIQYTVGGQVSSGDLPKVSVSETDSIVRVQDRQIVAIGGLMSQRATKNKSGVTGLSDLPFIGGLFRQKADSTTKSELVVLIKPTIIGDDGDGFERQVADESAD